ncbi:MAG TPA: hypothetical protein VFB62_06235, partial [Polyangiaceae bacterium]|nr:hypothetical protein [Polyangiaceae bacterium]
AMPDAKWHVHEPAASTSAHEGTRAVFGDPLDARYQLDEADVVLSLDADLFGTAEGNPRYMREFADRRRSGIASSQMNRVYAVESSPGLLGAVADHRVAVRASEIEHVARAIAAKVIGDEAIKAGAQSVVDEAWLQTAANDLKEAGEHALVVPGKYQPAIVHRLAHAMNMALGAVGKTVDFIEPVLARSNQAASLSELAEALDAGKVDLLVVMGVNPVYSAPGDLDFATRFTKAKLRIHLGGHVDETAALCHWHIPEAHPFESWGDAKSYDGTMGFIQPLIEPLYGGKSSIEMLAALGERPDRTSYEMVREYWMSIHTRGDFEHMWRRSLHDGVLAGSRGRAKQELKTVDTPWPAATPLEKGLELVFRPHASLHDGRYANNGWLQELPEPLTKLTWDNALWVAPELAKELDLETEDVVELAFGNAKVRAPVWVMPGAPKSSVTVHLGYGRVRGGKVLVDTGFDAYPLRTSAQPWHAAGVTINKTSDTRDLATAQLHHSMEGRDIVRSASVKEYFEDASVLLRHAHGSKERLSMYPRWKYPGYAWGMAIDLASCLGCSACVVACQAENNVPVVGKSQVLVGREMHWLRVDRYYEGEPEAPRTHFQPIPCMQCETAPCEAVCPVAATAHHDEGLNDMVYNRCVGTRYCQNNCPYKVRRFNFHRYSTKPIGPLDPSAPSMRLLFNPDVTVRSVGVMEKCTYCVQRISQARITSKREDRRITDGEVMTACQAACPARAITFGDINDKDSEVAKRKSEVRNYALLAELNTEPRTTYLAKIDNPHPALRAPTSEPSH